MSDLFQRASAHIKHGGLVVDFGCGIRPQQIVRASAVICVEPFGEYVEVLRAGHHFVMQMTAEEFLKATAEYDTAVLLDVIEHLEKDAGLRLIEALKSRFRQIVIFTPLGFYEQSYEDGDKDAWGMNGMEWQTHRSGWTPEEFPGWKIEVDPTFHPRGGAFFAIWNSLPQ
jgi:hypothetical protein